MRVCYFGAYPSYYPRHRVIIKGLRQHGVDVIEVRDSSKIYLRYPRLLKKYSGVNSYDVMIAGELSHYVMPLAIMLKGIARRPLISDPFTSLYDTNIDRGFHPENSFVSKCYFYFDKYSDRFSDIILQCTYQDIAYYHNTFGIEKRKLRRVFVGAEDDIFYPRPNVRNDTAFEVLFYGGYIPAHGIEYIIKAAKLLERHRNIRFHIIGTGQTQESIRELCKRLKIVNVRFTDWVDYTDLPIYISNSDVCLGIFGASYKASRVIPTKAYQAIAMKKPLITGDSPAARELFSNMNNAILCETANPRALADSILMLRDNRELREVIAENGYDLFKERLTPGAIGLAVKDILEELV